jgi:hypothetical protein
MKHRRHFRNANDVALREAARIGALISDLDRRAQLLDRDISAEEEHAQLFDPSHPAYPILARTLTERRDNLRAHHRRAGKATCQSSCALLSLGSSLVRIPAAGYESCQNFATAARFAAAENRRDL